MTVPRVLLMIACLLPGVTRASLQLAEDPPLALVGARVMSAPGSTTPDVATVIVRAGRVEAMGPDVDVPFDARVVDVSGLVLAPAFIDALARRDLEFAPRRDQQGRAVDLGADVMAAMFEAERTGLAPERTAWSVLPQDAAEHPAEREGGFGAVVVAPAGQLLAGTGAWLALSGRPPREAVMRPSIAQFGSLAWRTGPENYRGDRYPATLMGVMAHLRQVLLDADNERALRARGDVGRRGPADAVLDALAPVLDGTTPLVLRADAEEDVRLALGLTDMFPGVRLVIAGGREAWPLADELAARGVAVVHDFDFGKEPEDPDADPSAKSKGRRGERSEEQEQETDPEAAPPDVATDQDAEVSGEARPEAPDEASAERVEDASDPQSAGGDADALAVWHPKSPTRLRRDVRDRWLDDVRGPKLLVDAGVIVAAGSQGRSTKDLLDGLALAREKGGLTEEDSLAILTGAAHAAYDGAREDGEIRAGASAFLVGWTKGPFAEKTAARVLVVDGVLFDLRTPLDRDADARAAATAGAAASRESQEDAPASAEGEAGEALEAAGEHVADEGGAGADAGDASGEPTKADSAEDEDVLEWPVELDADREPSFRTGGDVLVRHATIHTASRGTLEDADLLVSDGRIAEIGPGLTAPDGVRVVDATGMHLIPGIIDCHSHAAIRGGVNEWTRVITPEVSIEDEVDPDDVSIYRALAGGVTSMRLLHGSANAIGGRHEVVKLRWGKSAPEMVFEGAPRGVKFALGENPRQSNFGDGGRFPRTRMGVEVVLRRAFEAAEAYRASWALHASRVAGGEDPVPPRRDLRLEALAGILDGTIQVHSHCYQADEMLMLIRVAEDYGFRVATLQHVLEGYKVAAEIAAHGAGGSTFVDWWGYKFEAYDATPYCAALMNEAGVLMSVNSDSDEHLRRLYLEAAKTVKYGGVAEEQALRMVTLNPAIQLGIDAHVGSIDVGKDADFALFTHHPFDVRTRCAMTFVDGELYFERRDEAWRQWGEHVAARIESAAPFAVAAAAVSSGSDGSAEAGESGDPGAVGGAAGAGGSSGEALAVPNAAKAAEAMVVRRREVPASALEALPLPRHATRAASTPERPLPGPVALVGGTVHTMERDGGEVVVYEPGVVLMRDGRLVGVYEGMAPPPEGYDVRDVRGLHVWPGLIDAGCSVGLVEIDSVAGSADVREIGRDQPDLRAAAGWHADSEHIPVTRANGTTCALVVPAGGRVLGQSSAMALEGWTADDALVRDAVALHVRAPRTSREPRDDEKDEPDGLAHRCEVDLGAAHLAGGAAPTRVEDEDEDDEDDDEDDAEGGPDGGDARERSKDDEKLIERVDESWADLRRMFDDAREHARVAGEAAARGVPGPEPDPRLAALAPYALGLAPVVFEAESADQIMDALRFARAQGLRIVIAGGRDAWKVADELALAQVPVLLGPVLRMPGAREDPYDATYHAAAVLSAAGVPLAFRSNDSASARDLPYHAGMAVAFGLDEDAAMEALTAGAARILGLADEVGTLAPGRRADVIVTDGSPLQIRTQVRAVYVGGRETSLETRHTRLYERYRARLHDPGLPSR